MRKSFDFEVEGHSAKVLNSWFGGAKLYIDGDLVDSDEETLSAINNETLLSANLIDGGILQIKPLSKVFSVEIDAYLMKNCSTVHVFSSHKELETSE